MKKKSRIKRKIVNWQTNDQGANPLNSRGMKYLRKEIRKVKSNPHRLRQKLENQVFEPSKLQGYDKWVSNHGGDEVVQGNPDLLWDDKEDTVDGEE
jgi:hypothetical protein